MSRSLAVTIAMALAAAAACGEDGAPGGLGGGEAGAGGTGGTGGSGVTCAIKIGTGEESFTPLADGDAVDVTYGSQGGYHIWGAFLARGFDPKAMLLLEYDLLFEDGGVYKENSFCIPPLEGDPTVAGWKQHTGLFGYLPFDADPHVDLAGGKRLRLYMKLRNGVVKDPETGSCRPEGEPTCAAEASVLIMPVVPAG